MPARGSKIVYTRSTEKKGQKMIVACDNAAGPPMVIFDAKKLNHGGQEVTSLVPVMDLVIRGGSQQSCFFAGWQSIF